MEPKKCLDNPNYLVYPDGRIYSLLRNKFLQPWVDSDGYLRVELQTVPKLVHRLVAECFIPNPQNYETVNHKDENKLNNHIDNLEWMSRENNVKYSQNNAIQMLDKETGEVIQSFVSMSEAERQTGIYHGNISKVCQGKRRTAGGYLWKKCETVDNPREKE